VAQQEPTDFRRLATPIDHRLEISIEVHHPNAIDKLRATLVISYRSTTRPYTPRPHRRS
jgi:hypothetical protein